MTHPKPSTQHFPLGIFSMIMGLTGLGLGWQKAAVLLAWPQWISSAIIFFSLTTFVVLLYFFAKKALFYFRDFRADFTHPIRMNFAPTVSISLILLGTAFLPISPDIGAVFWTIGSTLQIILTLFIVHTWIMGPQFDVKHLNPAWFIPAVGNVIIPVAGVHYAPLFVSYFFFAVGVGFWLVLSILLFFRLFFYPSLPEKLQATLFILLAPPSVALISYVHIQGGNLDLLAHLLYGFSLFIFLLLLTFIPKLIRLPFFISWWAYSFPLAAFILASFLMFKLSAHVFYATIAASLLIVLSLVIVVLLGYTLRALVHQKIGLPEE